MADELRMDAYYYGFTPTGVREIDMILSAVACAGKAFHHTEDWNDASSWSPHEGATPVDWIQRAANKAAAEMETLSAERDKWKRAYEDAKSLAVLAISR